MFFDVAHLGFCDKRCCNKYIKACNRQATFYLQPSHKDTRYLKIFREYRSRVSRPAA